MITIIDYGLGNLTSVKNAFDIQNIPVRVSSDPIIISNATSLVLPGVGAAPAGMKNLRERGLDRVITEQVKRGKPFLGICLGMQLSLGKNEEGNSEGLNLLKGTVKKFESALKIPQVGWNQVEIKDSLLFKGIKSGNYFYFVHSYYCLPEDDSAVIGTTEYGENFCSALEKNNIYGVQFHPEKSGEAGLQILKNFSEIVS